MTVDQRKQQVLPTQNGAVLQVSQSATMASVLLADLGANRHQTFRNIWIEIDGKLYTPHSVGIIDGGKNDGDVVVSAV